MNGEPDVGGQQAGAEPHGAREVVVEFLGETYPVPVEATVTIGRDADVSVDDNPYLHRRLLSVTHLPDLVWLANVGGRLTATVADGDGRVESWLAPGARVPLVFRRNVVWFTAGPTTYELTVQLDRPPFAPAEGAPPAEDTAGRTIGHSQLTAEQRLLVVALAEPFLRNGQRGHAGMPSSAVTAQRLGWTTTKFNRKLDNVCEKLSRSGVRGLMGSAGQLAVDRKSRLVEYALATRMVSHDDLALLPTRVGG